MPFSADAPSEIVAVPTTLALAAELRRSLRRRSRLVRSTNCLETQWASFRIAADRSARLGGSQRLQARRRAPAPAQGPRRGSGAVRDDHPGRYRARATQTPGQCRGSDGPGLRCRSARRARDRAASPKTVGHAPGHPQGTRSTLRASRETIRLRVPPAATHVANESARIALVQACRRHELQRSGPHRSAAFPTRARVLIYRRRFRGDR
jgi:hypothetical protein